MQFQNLKNFRLPGGFRGKPAWYVQSWWLVQMLLFKTSPQFMYGWRRFLLRSFGARIGRKAIIRPTVHIQFPWKLEVGDYSWIGDDVVLYNLGEIKIGSHSVISQRSYLCTGSHEHNKETFSIYAEPIVVNDQCWLAADVFVAPGVHIGMGTVVGTRSCVFESLPEAKICFGSPAVVVKDRVYTQDSLKVAFTRPLEMLPVELWAGYNPASKAEW